MKYLKIHQISEFFFSNLYLFVSLYLSQLVQRDFHVTIRDLLLQILRVFPIDRATHRDARVENLLDGLTEVFGHGSMARNLGGLNDVIEGDIPVVLDILHLLPAMLRLFQCLDDQSRHRWHHWHLGLTILHNQLHRRPIFGANELAIPTSPPVTRSLCQTQSLSLSNWPSFPQN